MNNTMLAPKPHELFFEKLLWFAGRFLHLIPSEMHVRVPFGVNRGRRWVRGSANAPEWLGIYEYRKQRLLRRLVPRGATVCDIGANAGFYSLGMSRLVGENGRVISFEPLPENLAKLRCHLSINKIDNVTLSDCALSDKSDHVTFAPGENDFTGSISSDATDSFRVPTISLDEFIAEHAIVDPTFLKIDVEGAEASVLAGARKLLERAHPTMLIAIHGRLAATECYTILRQAGYTVTTLNGVEISSAETMPAEILARRGAPTQLALEQLMSAHG